MAHTEVPVQTLPAQTLPAQTLPVQSLHVDHFGLSIGPVSVGLPLACTADDVYRRYLDLLQILQKGPITIHEPPADDLVALAHATRAECAYVARRLAALQAD